MVNALALSLKLANNNLALTSSSTSYTLNNPSKCSKKPGISIGSEGNFQRTFLSASLYRLVRLAKEFLIVCSCSCSFFTFSSFSFCSFLSLSLSSFCFFFSFSLLLSSFSSLSFCSFFSSSLLLSSFSSLSFCSFFSSSLLLSSLSSFSFCSFLLLLFFIFTDFELQTALLQLVICLYWRCWTSLEFFFLLSYLQGPFFHQFIPIPSHNIILVSSCLNKIHPKALGRPFTNFRLHLYCQRFHFY